MSDQDYIRKAIGLADHFDFENDELIITPVGTASMDYVCEYHSFTDLLAAQLVRQVDALDTPDTVEVTHNKVWVGYRSKNNESWRSTKGPDRAMNTIRAIVDSGILRKPKMCNFQGCKHTMDCALHRNEGCDCSQSVPVQTRREQK